MKRLLFAFILAALCVALCACTPKPTTTMPPTSCPPSLHAFHSCDATGAVSLTKVTTVTFGEELLAKDETTFDFTAGTYTQKTTLRNEAGAAEPFTETTETGSTTLSYGKLPLEPYTVPDFTVNETANGGSGTLRSDALAELLGVYTAPASTADVSFICENDHISFLTLTYETANGNSVTVSFTFTY